MALVDVHFKWDDRFGRCYDCGLPAAYGIVSPLGIVKYCSVCAASLASDGEQITYLFEED